MIDRKAPPAVGFSFLWHDSVMALTFPLLAGFLCFSSEWMDRASSSNPTSSHVMPSVYFGRDFFKIFFFIQFMLMSLFHVPPELRMLFESRKGLKQGIKCTFQFKALFATAAHIRPRYLKAQHKPVSTSHVHSSGGKINNGSCFFIWPMQSLSRIYFSFCLPGGRMPQWTNEASQSLVFC